ncbi:MAG: hypothetical protein LBP24_02445 [Coriobacteriales bacterium]|jgi:hypothetical protein|nr:hypothetical protein [Coriobacteriales bacterium]
MKYITEEMWPGSFGIDKTDRSWKLLDTLWESRMALYREELATIANRLDVRVARRFATTDFHGFHLEKMELMQGERIAKSRVTIRLEVSDGTERYEVVFKSVQKFDVGTVESARDDKDKDIWGFSEVLPAGDKNLSFEVIFSSGMSLHIIFPNKCLKVRKLQPSGDA